MKIISIIKAATLGNTKIVRPMILWTILEYALRGAPYGILLLAIWEMFKPLQNPGIPINVNRLLLITAGLLFVLLFLYFVSKRAYNEAYFTGYNISAEGRLRIGDSLKKLSMGFFNSRDPGDIGSYLINDYANIEFMFTHIVPQMIGAFAMPVVLIIALMTINWKLALLTSLVIPVAVAFSLLAVKVVQYFGKRHQKDKIRAVSRMLEYLHGIRLIKAFNLYGKKFQRLEKAFRQLKTTSIKLEATPGPLLLLTSVILNGGITLIILLGLTFLVTNEIALPVYIMFLIVGIRIFEPLMQALMFMAESSYFEISVNRIERLRKTPILEGNNPEIKPESYNIEFRNVSFRYNDVDVLKNVSLEIPEKSLVAFV